MKVIWDAQDITPGRRVRTIGCNETWMFGYSHADPSDRHWMLISTIDGCVACRGATTEHLSIAMNEGSYYPAEMLNEAGQIKLTNERR